MKILNEGNLVQFATGNSAVDKEGWLLKKSDTGKVFNKRWCVLKGNLFFYFEKPHDKDPHGVIILEGHTVELADNNDLEQFEFQISFRTQGGGRKYTLVAETSDLMESWMKSITCASYSYMRALLAGLQSQLDSLNSQELERALPSHERDSAVVHRLPVAAIQSEAAPAPTSSPRQARRKNPFNTKSMNEALDPFGQTPFVAAGTEEPVPPSPPLRSKKHKARKEQSSQFYTSCEESSEGRSTKNGTSKNGMSKNGMSEFYTSALPPSKFDELHKRYKAAIERVVQGQAQVSQGAPSGGPKEVLDLIGFN